MFIYNKSEKGFALAKGQKYYVQGKGRDGIFVYLGKGNFKNYYDKDDTFCILKSVKENDKEYYFVSTNFKIIEFDLYQAIDQNMMLFSEDDFKEVKEKINYWNNETKTNYKLEKKYLRPIDCLDAISNYVKVEILKTKYKNDFYVLFPEVEGDESSSDFEALKSELDKNDFKTITERVDVSDFDNIEDYIQALQKEKDSGFEFYLEQEAIPYKQKALEIKKGK